MGAVSSEAPERLVMLVQVVLKGDGGGARAVVGREGGAAPVERLRRGNDDDRHTTATGDTGDHAGCVGKVGEAERFLQEVPHKAVSGFWRRCPQLGERIEVCLTDTEGEGDLLPDSQALADAVTLFALLRGLAMVDLRHHRRRDEIALQRERGPGGHVREGPARHRSRLAR